MVSILQASRIVAPGDRVAGLVGGLVNTKALAAIFEHLRHEGQLVEAPIFIECSENLFLAQNLDPVAGTQSHVQRPTEFEVILG